MTMSIYGAPTLADVKDWLGLDASDVQDDVVLQESLDAALVAQKQLVCYPCDGFGDQYFSNDLRTAVFLRTQRAAARRNSPEGVIGISSGGGDFVAARLSSGDPDVLRFEGPYLRIPVA